MEESPKEAETKEEQKWAIEHAKSGRSRCQTCGGAIQKYELSLGEPSFFHEHLSYRWHHLSCAKSKVGGIPPEQLAGFQELSAEEKEMIR